MKDIVQELLEKGIATANDDNSVGVIFPDELKIPSCILQKRDGTHGYLASDLAAIKYRVENWNPEKMLYFVDVRQQLHLKQAFTIAKLAGWVDKNNEIHHAYNGFISLKEGTMSTREGRIIKLDALFDEAQDRAKKIILEKRSDIEGEELEKLAEIIGIGAIKYGYLKKSRESDVIFDWDEFMSFDGNSGPYIQYSYVRAKKILEKREKYNLKEIQISQKEEKELLSHLLTFPQVLQSMQYGYHAHILCQYIYDASKLLSSFYASISILQEEDISKR
jgi:arginyl-tRNA synthetase